MAMKLPQVIPAGIAILLLRIYNKHTEEEPIITEEVNED